MDRIHNAMSVITRHHEGSGRAPSFGQSCGRGLGRRTTWRRLGGSCAMTSDLRRLIIITCMPNSQVIDFFLNISSEGSTGTDLSAQKRARWCAAMCPFMLVVSEISVLYPAQHMPDRDSTFMSSPRSSCGRATPELS